MGGEELQMVKEKDMLGQLVVVGVREAERQREKEAVGEVEAVLEGERVALLQEEGDSEEVVLGVSCGEIDSWRESEGLALGETVAVQEGGGEQACLGALRAARAGYGGSEIGGGAEISNRAGEAEGGARNITISARGTERRVNGGERAKRASGAKDGRTRGAVVGSGARHTNELTDAVVSVVCRV